MKVVQMDLFGDIAGYKTNYKSNHELFVTRIETDGDIKVVLDPSIETYHYTHEGIDFFVYRSVFTHSSDWDSIEKTTGAAMVMSVHTRNGCVKKTKEWIDNAEDVKGRVVRLCDKTRDCDIIEFNEYINLLDIGLL